MGKKVKPYNDGTGDIIGMEPVFATADFILDNHGSIFLLTPITGAALAWCDDYLAEDAPRWGHCAYAIEARFVGDIVDGIEAHGLTVDR